MSNDTICPSCSAPTVGEAICPSCFFSAPRAGNLYTLDTPSQPTLTPSRASTTLSAFQTLTFLPSSPLKRAWLKVRGGVATLLCCLIFTAGSFYLWVGYQMELAHSEEQLARQASGDKLHDKALQHWNKAHEHYRSAFYSEGRLKALLALANCHIEVGDHEMALSTLSRAEKLGQADDIAEAVARCHAHWGAASLQSSIESLQAGSYGNAILESEKALDSLEKGRGTPTQLAKAHRVLALSLAKTKQFESAELHLEEALKLEGPTANNKSTEKRVKSLAKAHRKRKLADSGNHRYISDKKLDLSKTKQMKRRRGRRYYSGWSKPLPRTSTSSPSSYPKYRPPEPSYDTTVYHTGAYQRPHTYTPPSTSYPKPNYPKVQTSQPQVYQPRVNAPRTYKPPSYSPPSYSNPGRGY